MERLFSVTADLVSNKKRNLLGNVSVGNLLLLKEDFGKEHYFQLRALSDDFCNYSDGMCDSDSSEAL